MMFKYQLNECSEISFALLQRILNYNNKCVCTLGEDYNLLKSSPCFCHCCNTAIIKSIQMPYIKRDRVLFSYCCIFPFLYKDKVLYRSTKKYKNTEGIKKCFSKNSKNISVNEKNLGLKPQIQKNNLKLLENCGIKRDISSKFKKNYCRCVQTIKNSIFRSDLNILLLESKTHSLKRFKMISRGVLSIEEKSGFKKTPKCKTENWSKFSKYSKSDINSDYRSEFKILLVELVKLKIYILKELKIIFRGILFVCETSIFKDTLNLAKKYSTSIKSNLLHKYQHQKSIHSLIGGKLCQ